MTKQHPLLVDGPLKSSAGENPHWWPLRRLLPGEKDPPPPPETPEELYAVALERLDWRAGREVRCAEPQCGRAACLLWRARVGAMGRLLVGLSLDVTTRPRR